jgi:hypothetical protein
LSTTGYQKIDFNNAILLRDKIFKVNHIRIDPSVAASTALDSLKNYASSLATLFDRDASRSLEFKLSDDGTVQFLS